MSESTERECRICKVAMPLTSDWFEWVDGFGFSYWCLECDTRREARLNQTREREREYAKVYREKNREAIYDGHRRWREANLDHVRTKKRRYYYKPGVKERQEQQRIERNRRIGNDPVLCQERRDKRRRYNADNRTRLNEYFRQYKARRRARKLGLPDNYAPEDWQHALNYFNGCCAVCGRQLKDLFGTHTAAMDHWIPIVSDDCPGTIPANIVPLCNGLGGCNQSKNGSDPVEWLNKKFSPAKAKKVLDRVEAYFESLGVQR